MSFANSSGPIPLLCMGSTVRSFNPISYRFLAELETADIMMLVLWPHLLAEGTTGGVPADRSELNSVHHGLGVGNLHCAVRARVDGIEDDPPLLSIR